MPYLTPIQTRFNDTDGFGHINNATYATYVEYARLIFLKEIAGLGDNVILAHLSLDFTKQVKFLDEITVSTVVKKLGTSSITLYQDVIANGEIAAKVNSVVVHFNYQTQSSEPIPQGVREKLEPFLELAIPNT
ncbi:MAG: acyl-CoA thioesterase [Trueperaceae bacterium]|nr:acyl-CoA thioesterase [Trueperaceae bacterium]